MKQISLVCVLVFVFSRCVDSKGLPSFLHLCKINDPELQECVFKNVDLLRPRLAKGIPELFIPPLNPLVIPEASLDTGDSFQGTFKNIEIYNTHEFTLNHVDFDLKKYHVDLNITFPKLRIKSMYNIKGRILILNLDGHGPADGNLTNVLGSIRLNGKEYFKKNKRFVQWEKESIDLNVGKPHFLFENIFGNNTELNDRTNVIINENIEDILVDLLPVVKQIVNDFIFSIVNRLFSRYSIDELFPSS